MTLYFQTRNWWAGAPDAEGVVKLCCFGDSTMFGLGVLPDESLPSRLEQHLNETHPSMLFMAENHGVPGSNLFEVWAALREYLATATCDLVLISVCNNDASLFEKILGGTTYPNTAWPSFARRDAFWLGMNDAIREVFEGIRAITSRAGIPVAVVWLGHRDSDLPLVEQVERLCEEAGFPLFDSVSVLRRHFGPDADAEVTASELDVHHLNARALDIMARHLALAIRDGVGFRAPEMQQGRGDVTDRIAEAAMRMSGGGWPDLAPFRWAQRTIAAKSRIAGRLASGQELEAMRRQLTSAAATWTDRYTAHVQFLSGQRSDDRRGADFDLLHEAANHLVAVDELTCGATLRQPSSVDALLYGRFAEINPGRDPGDGRYFQATLHEAVEQLSVAEHRAARAPDRHGRPAAELVQRCLGRARRAAARLRDVPFGELSRERQAAATLAVDRFRVAAGQLCDVTGPYGGETAADYSDFSFHTTVDLHVEYPRREPQRLIFVYVTVSYRAPVFAPVRDFHWIETTDRPRVYRLQFPLILKGQLTLTMEAVDDCGEDLRIVKRVEVWNSPRNKVDLWRPEWGRGQLSRTLVRDVQLT